MLAPWVIDQIRRREQEREREREQPQLPLYPPEPDTDHTPEASPDPNPDDALLAGMQAADARERVASAFAASPAELGRAAVEASGWARK